jgi:hypothetical protein
LPAVEDEAERVMQKEYYDTVDKLERMGVQPEYIQGWVGGYLGNPKREEQRLTDAYNAGYEDGCSKTTAHADAWKQAK